MRDPTRINAIIKDLRLAWENFPEMPLTQLLSCATHIVSETDDEDAFFIDDDRLRQGLQVLQHLEY